MIRFDRSSRSVVAICTACGRRELLNDQREADGWAEAHVERAHVAPSRERELAVTAARVRRYRR